MNILSCLCQAHLFIPSLSQGYPGEKGTTGSSDIIDFNGKLLDAFQVRIFHIPLGVYDFISTLIKTVVVLSQTCLLFLPKLQNSTCQHVAVSP